MNDAIHKAHMNYYYIKAKFVSFLLYLYIYIVVISTSQNQTERQRGRERERMLLEHIRPFKIKYEKKLDLYIDVKLSIIHGVTGTLRY